MADPKGKLVTPVGIRSDGAVVAPFAGGHVFQLERIINERKDLVSPANGLQQILSSAVPAGKIWVITLISSWCSNGNVTTMQVLFAWWVDNILVAYTTNPPHYVPTITQATGLLRAGELCLCEFHGTVVGDDLGFSILGYEMSAP